MAYGCGCSHPRPPNWKLQPRRPSPPPERLLPNLEEATCRGVAGIAGIAFTGSPGVADTWILFAGSEGRLGQGMAGDGDREGGPSLQKGSAEQQFCALETPNPATGFGEWVPPHAGEGVPRLSEREPNANTNAGPLWRLDLWKVHHSL